MGGEVEGWRCKSNPAALLLQRAEARAAEAQAQAAAAAAALRARDEEESRRIAAALERQRLAPASGDALARAVVLELAVAGARSEARADALSRLLVCNGVEDGLSNGEEGVSLLRCCCSCCCRRLPRSPPPSRCDWRSCLTPQPSLWASRARRQLSSGCWRGVPLLPPPQVAPVRTAEPVRRPLRRRLSPSPAPLPSCCMRGPCSLTRAQPCTPTCRPQHRMQRRQRREGARRRRRPRSRSSSRASLRGYARSALASRTSG